MDRLRALALPGEFTDQVLTIWLTLLVTTRNVAAMQADGDAMVGMYRMGRSGKTVLTELYAFERRAGGLRLTLRRFDPGLAAREEEGPGTGVCVGQVGTGAGGVLAVGGRDAVGL
jgi:hypothetical protein